MALQAAVSAWTLCWFGDLGARIGDALVEAAKAASRTKGTYYLAQYSRLAKRCGPNRATVACSLLQANGSVAWAKLTSADD